MIATGPEDPRSVDRPGRVRCPDPPDPLWLSPDYDEPIQAVVEAAYNWSPVYDWLTEVVDEVILAHPTKVRAIADARIKTDTIDSRTLAHLLRADLILGRCAIQRDQSDQTRPAPAAVLRALADDAKNGSRALLSEHAIMLPDVTDLYGKAGLEWLRRLTLREPDGRLLRDDLDLLETLRRTSRPQTASSRSSQPTTKPSSGSRVFPGSDRFSQ